MCGEYLLLVAGMSIGRYLLVNIETRMPSGNTVVVNYDYDPPLGPFAALYEEWTRPEWDQRERALRERLAATYRDAWAVGDWHEQYYVLSYIFDQRETGEGLDLVIEGLKTDEPRLAQHTAAHACVLHHRGLLRGPAVRAAFRRLVRRFPESHAFLPREFLGYEDGDEDDREERPCLHLYEAWLADYPAREGELFDGLLTACHGVWEHGASLIGRTSSTSCPMS
jgi:hypothetical protein